MSLRSIVTALKQQAEEQEARAYRILGARPGPGFDLLIYPVEPMCGRWYVDGLTQAGKNWLNKFWPYMPLKSNQHIDQLKREARDWNLRYETRYPIQPLE
jgi:hypothetical protein